MLKEEKHHWYLRDLPEVFGFTNLPDDDWRPVKKSEKQVKIVKYIPIYFYFLLRLSLYDDQFLWLAKLIEISTELDKFILARKGKSLQKWANYNKTIKVYENGCHKNLRNHIKCHLGRRCWQLYPALPVNKKTRGLLGDGSVPNCKYSHQRHIHNSEAFRSSRSPVLSVRPCCR